jgi:hypothetical protein
VSNYLKSKKNSFHADEEACNLDEATEEDAITVSLIFFHLILFLQQSAGGA